MASSPSLLSIFLSIPLHRSPHLIPLPKPYIPSQSQNRRIFIGSNHQRPDFRLSYRLSTVRSFEESDGDDCSFDRAVSLFNNRDYYKCHDFLEELWNGAEEPRRTLIHGILQCAVGFHHLFNQNHRGAMMELGEGLCKLRKMNFTDGPFHQFEQEISAALDFIYQTQLELAACTDDFCLAMDGSERSYQLLGSFAAGQRLYRLERDPGSNNLYIVFFPEGSYNSHKPARVKVPTLHATEEHLKASALGAILHVMSTSLLGITAITMANSIAGEDMVHKLASLLLVVLGGSYILLFMLGKGGHNHSHNHPMEKMAVAGLVLVPALSPCATTLPMFLAVGNSSSMMVLAIIVLLFSTVIVMTSLVALSFYGASQLKFHWVERYDKLLVGTVLCLVGILTLLFHDHEGHGHSVGEHLHRKLIGL